MIAEREKAIQEKERLTQEIGVVGGLWINRADVEDGVSSISKRADKLKVFGGKF